MSATLSLEEITYRADSGALFEAIADLPGAAFLDSSHPHSQRGRYDILCALPAPTPAPPAPDADTSAWRSYYDELARFHRERYGDVHAATPDIPFSGGLLGFLGYDSGNPLNHVAARTSPGEYSGARVGAYDWALVQDHLLQRAVLVAQPSLAPGVREDLRRRLAAAQKPPSSPFALKGRFQSNFTADEYRAAFARIRDYIEAGDCYQVNLAQRFHAACHGDPWHAYRALRVTAAAPYSAYLALPEGGAIMSLSPERFLALHGQHVQTAPIKGTRARHADTVIDEMNAAQLRRSIKDRAENLMIVDLLRNDLGRNCVPGSIHVDALFEVHSFPTVHHLVSSISGDLRPGRGAYDLLRDSFPGGSITGAPKRRSMQIIAELEPDPREVYCGSIFYVSADGRMDSNIAIRTLLCAGGEIRCWGGGGIVADSEWDAEYQETFDKVGRFLEVLEAMN
ncbi:aminodeoxychorismate synthase component I [Mangrovimicrobium sediminis]|uniref:aminodeoxychorismate synthase n=1 Tax=Mangrovimicrobium sediminis TaxID=2562682 RepID=A0A4Z0M7I1_9GAMM|nr:aminodeoxychorismate synthase component I [Haliea sp. SAOS-164]TGD75265.1 aminodeoxychorismate synthase component I [Haliea sp. SAOS-164]